MQKGKMVVCGGLTNAYEKKRSKGKGEKERCTHLNAEFQRMARRDKKAFLSDQCKEIDENNRIGNTRDLFNKSRDTKGTFHTKMGSIKDRDGMDLTEAEVIKKRSQKYTEELYKTDDNYFQKERYSFSCIKLKNIFSICLVYHAAPTSQEDLS